MKIELDDYSKEILEKAEKITGTDYERKGNYIELKNLIAYIEDLEYEIGLLEEKIEDTEAYYHDNYKPVNEYTMYGINPSMFH